MKIKLTTLAIVALVSTLLGSVLTCRYHAQDAAETHTALDSTISAFKVIKNKEGKEVVEQAPAQFADGKPLKDASAKAFNLSAKEERKVKDVEFFAQIEQDIAIKDTVQAVAAPDSFYHFAIKKPEYTLAGRMRNNLLLIDSLAVYNTLSLRIAEKKTGFFKSELIVQATNTNKYITTPAMRSMTVAYKANAWHRYIKPALFAAAGYSIARAIK